MTEGLFPVSRFLQNLQKNLLLFIGKVVYLFHIDLVGAPTVRFPLKKGKTAKSLARRKNKKKESER